MKKAHPRPEADPQLEVRRLWIESKLIAGSPAEAYLIGLGYTEPIPPSLRYRPPGRYRLPMILAAVQAPDRRIVALQLILLDRERPVLATSQSARIVVGRVEHGSAVRLAAAGPNMATVFCNVEDGLLAMQRTGRPTWVALGSIATLQVAA